MLLDAWDYVAMDTMTVSIAGAPKSDELLLAVTFRGGTRPNARIKSASPEQVREAVRQIQGSEPG
ncbi:MAG: amino acid synthesis family protein [Betaproteobacteria bacterium]|nr:amino acid synthesis family protein [Betaproteobacteria bacterium]